MAVSCGVLPSYFPFLDDLVVKFFIFRKYNHRYQKWAGWAEGTSPKSIAIDFNMYKHGLIISNYLPPVADIF